MSVTKDCQWICENAKALEKYAGQWVVFHPEQGVVGSADNVQKAIAQFSKQKEKQQSYVFHVPTPDELVSPFPAVRHSR